MTKKAGLVSLTFPYQLFSFVHPILVQRLDNITTFLQQRLGFIQRHRLTKGRNIPLKLKLFWSYNLQVYSHPSDLVFSYFTLPVFMYIINNFKGKKKESCHPHFTKVHVITLLVIIIVILKKDKSKSRSKT